MKKDTHSRPAPIYRSRLLALLVSLSLTAGCGSGGGSAVSTETPSINASFISDLDQLEEQDPVFLLTETRTIDGTLNHTNDLGSTGLVFAEDSSRAYADGFNSPSGSTRPNPRSVSNAVVAQTADTPDAGGRTAYLWLWGQFLDHDITLTHDNGLNDFPIAIPLGDTSFDPFATGVETMDFSRSEFALGSGTGIDNQRAQVNSITSFIDASMVYGSDDERANALRTFVGGALITSSGELLPFNTAGLENAGGTGATLFLGGDVRANENVLLTSMHTVFLREHNRIAAELASQFPNLTDEELYQGARKLVGAIVQSITYNEYLPALLGPNVPPAYTGYDPTIDPSLGILFSTAAYRLGHSQVGSSIPRLDANGDEIALGHLNVADAFFNPSAVSAGGIEPLLRGAATEPAQATDPQIIDDLRNLLFGPPGAGGLDLASLNIQRGRDHGLPDYNTIRGEFGLAPVADFSDMTSSVERQQALASVYSDPGQIDPWVGFLSEDPLTGSVLGPTLTNIISAQFQKLRDGDRFFYLNDPDLTAALSEIQSTRLSDVIERNTDIVGLQENLFFTSQTLNRATPSRVLQRAIPVPSL